VSGCNFLVVCVDQLCVGKKKKKKGTDLNLDSSLFQT